ncbi:competence type IV pilus major pilin ComGC [Streptococcus sp. S784/96/1]|uniref:competence type IV pilus major pilin ComGC n=1 Tax=Streptococcus sp. S784/96/1 TaxID=2653499 RepID=UPI0013868AC2|nr:competence type IV pilus major pilin ComGC [Streptococcus sp. S784/96/1]
MKKRFQNLKHATVQAFTLAEMLVVLLIISVLMLLFVPNLTKQKDVIQSKGNAAVVKVVESQMEMYKLEHDQAASAETLAEKGYITQDQLKVYNAKKNS